MSLTGLLIRRTVEGVVGGEAVGMGEEQEARVRCMDVGLGENPFHPVCLERHRVFCFPKHRLPDLQKRRRGGGGGGKTRRM